MPPFHLPLRERMQILPIAAVGGAIEQHCAADFGESRADTQVPDIAVFPGAGVAETGDAQARWRRLDHRLVQLFPDAKIGVARGRETLDFAEPFATNRLRRRSRHSGVKDGRYGCARQHASRKATGSVVRTRRRRESDGLMIPVNEIGTGRMVPVHVAPHRGMRVVLKEHVVLAAIKARRARIIHPVRPRKQMKLRAKRIVHQFLAESWSQIAGRRRGLLKYFGKRSRISPRKLTQRRRRQ